MSDELNPTPEANETVESSAPVDDGGAQEIDASPMYEGWDGELDSLDNQEWFTNIDKLQPDQIREAVRHGYKQNRDNVTRALHTKSVELAGIRRNLEGLQGTLTDRASQYANEIEKLQAMMTSDDGNADERYDALKSGFDTQLAEFKGKVTQFESQNRELFDDNRQLLTAYERAKGETQGMRQHFAQELNAFRANAGRAYSQMKQERDYLAQQVYETNQRQLDQEFDQRFTYLAKDEARRGDALDAYYGALQAHVQRNGGKLFPDDQWERIEEVTMAQVKALYPEMNPVPGSMPGAESLAQTPRSSGRSTYVPSRSPNKGTMF